MRRLSLRPFSLCSAPLFTALAASLALDAVIGCSSKAAPGPGSDASTLTDAPVDALGDASPGQGPDASDGSAADASRSAPDGAHASDGSGVGEGSVNPDAAQADSAIGGCASGLICDGHCVDANDVHHCGSCATDCGDLPHVADSGLACVEGRCTYTCASGFTACDDAGAGCPVDLSGSASGSPTCGSCGVTCNATGAAPDCAPSSDAGAFACLATCPSEAPTQCGQACVDVMTNVNHCGGCARPCATQVAHAHATCDAGACGAGCDPGYAACDGGCVDVANDPANCGSCGAPCGANMLCRDAACVCLLTCHGACVDSDVDPRNCGACGHDCLGGACSAGTCQPIVLATGQATPWCIAVDSQSVNWTNYYGPNVMRADLDGGSQVVLATGDEPYGIAVDSANVYWTDAVDGIVWRSPVDGGAKVALFTGTYQNEVRAIAVNASLVTWVDDNHGIYSVSPEGGTPLTVAASRYGNAECQLAFDATRVYWPAYPGQDAVQAAPLDGGGAIATLGAVSSNLGDTSAVAVDSTSAYFNQSNIGTILSVPLAGGAATTLTGNAGSPQAIVADGQRIYWADEDGTIRSVPAGGGPEIVHASNQGGPADLALDAKAIYWINRGDGTVMKVAR